MNSDRDSPKRPLIELSGVSKRFGDLAALHPTDLAFDTGGTTALIGPSGCGKSTILRLIIGLELPTTGEIRFDGEPLQPDSLPRVRRRAGYVIQDGGLFPHLTAGRNVTLMAQKVGWDSGRIRKRLSDLAELTHFPQDGLNRYPLELSGGQRQRVALMRGLMLEPAALLFDEPLGALDPMVRAGLQQELKSIFRELNQTVILVTHDMAEAGYLADRIVLMRVGRIVQEGGLDDLRERPAEPFVTEFLSAQRSLVQL